MSTFVMLTRLAPHSLESPPQLEELERRVMTELRAKCPEVEWVHSYAILGGCDYLDIFRAPDVETASKVSAIVRTFGHAQTEVWTAIEWRRFKGILHDLREPDEGS